MLTKLAKVESGLLYILLKNSPQKGTWLGRSLTTTIKSCDSPTTCLNYQKGTTCCLRGKTSLGNPIDPSIHPWDLANIFHNSTLTSLSEISYMPSKNRNSTQNLKK